jgi:TonB family protein
MEILSLQEPVEQPSIRVNRSEAVLLSLAMHLLLLLLFLFGRVVLSKVLPESVVAFLSARPRPTLVAAADTAAATSQPMTQPKDTSKIPLKFAYVNVPNDTPSPKNPKAPLYSDKNRRARQEVPTPRDARRFSIDPHSEGTSIDRVKPDPNRQQGREDVEPQRRAPRGVPTPAPAGRVGSIARKSVPRTEATPPPDGTRLSSEVARAEPAEPSTKEGSQDELGVPDGTGDAKDEETREGLKQALSNLKSGEYKFQFNNPAYLRGGGYGTMSFDTQDFPWGDYARRIYLVIRNNWYERIPLAAREGIRGFVCQHFVIEKNGSISSVQTVRPSGVIPFDKSSSDALSASSPLPPLPQDFPDPREGVTFCFYYNMVPGEESD